MAYVTLSETKDFLQITTTASDVLIQSYIDIVTGEVDAYTNRTLSEVTYSEVVEYLEDGRDRNAYRPYNVAENYPRLYLSEYPVVGDVELVYDSVTTVSTANYKTSSDNGVVFVYDYQADDQRKLEANYVAGYTTASAPAALKGVIYQGVKSYYENNSVAKQGVGNVKSKSLKDFSVSYGNEQSGLYTQINGKLVKTYLAANSDILDGYSRVIV